MLTRSIIAIALFTVPNPALSQNFPTDNPIIRQIWTEGMERSHVAALAQPLLDSIGPRLTGSPGFAAAADWVRQTYRGWGIAAEQQEYGTWNGWERGITHVDLIAPRVRTLEGMMLAWSPGTSGPIEGSVEILPDVSDRAAAEAWLTTVAGKFVMVSPPEPSCRARQEWEANGRAGSYERLDRERAEFRQSWNARLRRPEIRALLPRLAGAGVRGLVSSRWSEGWGVNKVFSALSDSIPSIDVSCEDYGLVYRLAENNQGPRLRLDAQSTALGIVPAFNIVGRIPGTELPNEYVMLSAHLDSWDGASGATDNGTGTVMMMEAMRILQTVYPQPKRTILVGHWGGEELGLVGSSAFAADHSDVIDGLQALFNQDNGTWRIEYIRGQGFSDVEPHFARWFSHIPPEIAGEIELDLPGVPERGGSDHMSFLCHAAPGFRLQSSYPEYRQYTWHTNRDTYDKIVFEDLRNNATLAAMLVYLASEDPERVPRDRRVLPTGENGERPQWPSCRPPRRSPN